MVAGGRRLRALNVLVKRGRLSADYEVLCAVVPAERAIAVSMAENQGQKPMSVADTVQAFADMVAAGAGIEDIAVCFGLTPLTVRRRVRLATVSPKLFALYRAGGMNMDQLMALSLADTHDKQEGAWECLPLYNRSANAIRSIIVGEGVSDSIVKFVGLEAYEQAGGHVIRDLFSDDDGVASHVGDPELMQRLATERLGALAQQEQGREGWAWSKWPSTTTTACGSAIAKHRRRGASPRPNRLTTLVSLSARRTTSRISSKPPMTPTIPTTTQAS